MTWLWNEIVRWRTLIFNAVGAFVVAILPLLGAPEIMAIVPTEYHKWMFAAVFLINYWMRPRAAVIKGKSK